MAAFRTGKVAKILESTPRLMRLTVELPGGAITAAAFPAMSGPIAEGDRVVVNTTGIELDLGTGGEGFVLWNLDGAGAVDPGEGHIVKLRYTPWQMEVMAVEAPESEHHEALASAVAISGVPVVACGLHSQIGAAAAGIKAAAPETIVGYLMTDAAALPLAWSRSVAALEAAGLIDVTCTTGHAFGGDLEATNVFSGLTALHHAGRAGAIVVGMGPGIVGTSTTLGFTAIEQGQMLDAVTALGGVAIAALRVSFVDQRTRHVGISHHTLTALSLAARERCLIAVPELPEEQMDQVRAQLQESGLSVKHETVEIDGAPGLRLLGQKGLRPTSMGRSMDETPELFVAASAAGALAARRI
jgi:hypothetical protein